MLHSPQWAAPPLVFIGINPGAGWGAEHRQMLREPLGIQARQVTVAGERWGRAEVGGTTSKAPQTQGRRSPAIEQIEKAAGTRGGGVVGTQMEVLTGRSLPRSHDQRRLL